MDLEAMIKMMCAIFGLPPETTAEGLAAHAKNLAGQVRGLAAGLAETAKALGLPEAVEAATLAAHAKELLSRSPDPAKYIPLGQYQELASAHAKLQSDMSQDKAQVAVEAAMKEGGIAPALKDWALAYASKDLAGIRDDGQVDARAGCGRSANRRRAADQGCGVA